ncbi:MAG: hypothetical protein U0931_39335, partial [Vulcanimicrobiota bacterium]
AAFLALATLLWAGMRQELHFTPQQASRTTDLWGMRLFTNRLEVAQIREIWARPLRHGCDFEVVGEERQLGGWMEDTASARWIVSRALRYYANTA